MSNLLKTTDVIIWPDKINYLALQSCWSRVHTLVAAHAI